MAIKKLTAKQEMVLTDLAAFITWSIKNYGDMPLDFEGVLYTVQHDIRGIAADDPYFLPRTSGYYKRVGEEKA